MQEVRLSSGKAGQQQNLRARFQEQDRLLPHRKGLKLTCPKMINKICSNKLLPKVVTMTSTVKRQEKGSNIKTLTNVLNEKLVLKAC